MKFLPFANRNLKEIIRDPLSIFFGVGFPVIIMILLTQLQKNIKGMPEDIFSIQAFAPGITVFGLGFLSLFLGILMATDRESYFLQRLFSSPLKSQHYIIGYLIPLIPIGILQASVCFAVAIGLGLSLDVNIIFAIISMIPVILLFTSFGMLFGVLLNQKQVGGAGSILVNAVAWLSGVWFSLDMVGGTYKVICEILPFYHAVQIIKKALAGEIIYSLLNFFVVIAYAIIIYVISAIIFHKKMQN